MLKHLHVIKDQALFLLLRILYTLEQHLRFKFISVNKSIFVASRSKSFVNLLIFFNLTMSFTFVFVTEAERGV